MPDATVPELLALVTAAHAAYRQALPHLRGPQLMRMPGDPTRVQDALQRASTALTQAVALDPTLADPGWATLPVPPGLLSRFYADQQIA